MAGDAASGGAPGESGAAADLGPGLGSGFGPDSGPGLGLAGERLVERARAADESADAEARLRPSSLDDFVGQPAVRANLKVFIEAARRRGAAMDHVLFYGPPGLGKTTLAQIVARELGVNFKMTSGPVIQRAGDLAALLTNLDQGDVLFIDEIHRLTPAVEEILYPAMEDFELDLVIGDGPAARSVRIDLQPFTLVGATTRLGLLTTPLRDRFGIPTRLDFYSVEDLVKIVRRAAGIFAVEIADDGAEEIARRARGTPRIAGRLLRRVADFAIVEAAVDARAAITRTLADAALRRLEVDDAGLDSADRRYLRVIAENYGGGPVGVDTIAAALSEARDALEEVIEPFLLQEGMIQRTPRGRMLAPRGWAHLGLRPPPGAGGGYGQPTLFDLAEPIGDAEGEAAPNAGRPLGNARPLGRPRGAPPRGAPAKGRAPRG